MSKLVRLTLHRRKLAREDTAGVLAFLDTARAGIRRQGARGIAMVIVGEDGSVGTAYWQGTKGAWAGLLAGAAMLEKRLLDDTEGP